MTPDRTYLDYNATAPLRPEARAAMVAALDVVGNPSSVHAEGRRARSVIEAARGHVADLVAARAADVVFTSGATEANATVLTGGWDTIVLCALEHESVRAAARRSGARIIEIPVDRHGQFDTNAFAASAAVVTSGTRDRTLLCLQLANNETGVIQPVIDATAIARRHGIRVHCDAVQAAGRLPIDCATLGVDYIALSAHKFGGPKGAGAIVAVDGSALRALITGGGQERGRRAGTENVTAIAGFGAAARAARDDGVAIERIEALRNVLEDGIAERTPDALIIGRTAPRLANTTCVAMPGLTAEILVIRFDLAGVAVSAGAACSSGKIASSVALQAMGLPVDMVRSAIRLSLGYASTLADVQTALAVWSSSAATHVRAA